MNFELEPYYPWAATDNPINLKVKVIRDNKLWDILYCLEGDIESINIPQLVEEGQRKDRLWEKTCFELFFFHPKKEEYFEWNFSPDTNWAFYHFKQYRQRHTEPTSNFEMVKINQYTDQRTKMILSARILFDTTEPLLSPCAVISHKNGRKSYFSSTHLREEPDFHDKKSAINFSI